MISDTALLAKEIITVYWLFGRGASMACGLNWAVPCGWREMIRNPKPGGPRRDVILERVKFEIREEMNSQKIDTSPYREMLSKLSKSTGSGYKHLFITTNWDHLLQREITRLHLGSLPRWLSNSHVYHVNGTVEDLADNSCRSPFLFEEDAPKMRAITCEANIAYNRILWGKIVIVIGMSFACQMDSAFLNALGSARDEMPIGKAKWLIINRNKSALMKVVENIRRVLPYGHIQPVEADFKQWVFGGMSDLRDMGVIA